MRPIGLKRDWSKGVIEHPLTKGQRTRREIIERAAPLFNQRGYAGTALSDVMESTHLEKGAIYRHFRGKDELALAAYQYLWEKLCAAHEHTLAQHKSPLAKLRQMITNFRNYDEQQVPGGCALMNAAIEGDDGNPLLREWAEKTLRQVLRRMRLLAARAKSAGELNQDADPEMMATLILATLEGALMIARLQRNGEPLRWAEQQLNRMIDSYAVSHPRRRGLRPTGH